MSKFFTILLFYFLRLNAWAQDCAQILPESISQTSFLQECKDVLTQEFSSEAVEFQSTQPHRVQLIEKPSDSLDLRLKLIQQAKRSIQIETFYFQPDQAGNKILAALIRKKQENPKIKIEILLDNWGSEGFSAALAAELIKLGVDVKFYNISSPLLFTRHNQRNHRKLFLIDADQSDGFALLGGVNTAAEHLGMHPSISKVDREILVQGPSLPKMQNNFLLFWEHPWSERKRATVNNASTESLTAKILRENQVPSLAESSVTKNNWISVPGLKFVSDAPGEGRANNRLQKDFQRQLGLTKQQLLIENGYFIPPQELREQFEKILQSGGRIEVLTDSPLSTSSYDVKKMALSYPHQRWLVGRGGEVSGSRGPGIHSKTLVQDQGNVFISSYNLDARSQNWNQELGIWFLGAEELAKLTALNMRNRKDEIGLRLDAQGKYGGLDLYEEFRSQNAGEERLTRWTRWLIESFY